MSGRTALVTGSTGFIGGKLAERLLADGWQVHALLRASSRPPAFAEHPGLTLHRDRDDLEPLTDIVAAAAPDVTFHLASLVLGGEHRADQVGRLVQSNIQFPARLIEGMARTGHVRLVNVGTGIQNLGGAGFAPANLYAATKQGLEDILTYYHEAEGISVVTLKPYQTYGEGDPTPRLISLLLRAARSGETLAMSPGEQVIDLSHVEDLVDALLVAAERLLEAPSPLQEAWFVSG